MWMGMFRILKADLKRHFISKNASLLQKVEYVLFAPGIWATIIYRTGNWVQSNTTCTLLRKALMFPLKLIQLFICFPIGIDISFNTTIGKGLYIGHFGGIVLNNEAIIGDFCNLSQGVTIGEGGRGQRRGTPVVGNRVYIGPGAKVFGRITIGNNVAIGANAVVNKDIPDNAVVGGVPAKILNFNSSVDFIRINDDDL